MIQRVYIDTSVVGGIYDTEFDVFTKMFFDKAFRREIALLVSDLLEEELINAPADIKTFFKALPIKQVESVQLTKDAIELAELYIVEKLLERPVEQTADTLHLPQSIRLTF